MSWPAVYCVLVFLVGGGLLRLVINYVYQLGYNDAKDGLPSFANERPAFLYIIWQLTKAWWRK